MQRQPQDVFGKLKNKGSLLVKKVKIRLQQLSLKSSLEYCKTFLDIQAKIEVDKMMDVIKDPEVTEAASRIIQYFESQDIYIKYILKDKELIKKADVCIIWVNEYPGALNKILLDSLKLKKAFAIIKHFENTLSKNNILSYIINESLLEDMYQIISQERSQDIQRNIELSDFNNRDTYIGYLEQSKVEGSKFNDLK